MAEKVGRNDPCPCGSGKKYKNCCFTKNQQQKGSSLGLGKRKFTAKVLSGGGVHKVAPEARAAQEQQAKSALDYTTLMERSFGDALHAHEDKPPVPTDPTQYLVPEEKNDSQQ